MVKENWNAEGNNRAAKVGAGKSWALLPNSVRQRYCGLPK